jgi:hypothetical protein
VQIHPIAGGVPRIFKSSDPREFRLVVLRGEALVQAARWIGEREIPASDTRTIHGNEGESPY